MWGVLLRLRLPSDVRLTTIGAPPKFRDDLASNRSNLTLNGVLHVFRYIIVPLPYSSLLAALWTAQGACPWSAGMSRHNRKTKSKPGVAPSQPESPQRISLTIDRRMWIGAALVIFGIGPMFLFPSYSNQKCPEVAKTDYRKLDLEVRTTDVHGRLEYCAFPYHYEGRYMTTVVYDKTPWSDFCGPTRAEVEARVTAFRKPAEDADLQCKQQFGDAVRNSLHQPLKLFGSS